MALNIKDPETERLAAEVANATGESKTRAVKVALQERKDRLRIQGASSGRGDRIRRFLEDEAWPQVPNDLLGTVITKPEREAILGYGPAGV